jgi:hypothetical protein
VVLGVVVVVLGVVVVACVVIAIPVPWVAVSTVAGPSNGFWVCASAAWRGGIDATIGRASASTMIGRMQYRVMHLLLGRITCAGVLDRGGRRWAVRLGQACPGDAVRA